MKSGMTIGEAARAAGVSVDTIRYYERRGLIPRARRSSSGYRQYGEDVIRRLRFIQNAQTLGFSLREIKDLLSLRMRPRTRCGDIKRKARAKLEDIEARIRSLQKMRRALKKIEVRCSGRGPLKECPILDYFDS